VQNYSLLSENDPFTEACSVWIHDIMHPRYLIMRECMPYRFFKCGKQKIQDELAENNPFKNAQIETHGNFYRIDLSPFQHPSRILALDVDDMLLSLSKTKETNKTWINNCAEIKELLRLAKQNNVMVVILTARYLTQERVGLISISNLLSELGENHFSGIFFTNYGPKAPVLEHLYSTHFGNGWFQCKQSKHKLCLVDDNKNFLVSCGTAGFDTILFDAEKKYLQHMNDFIRGARPIEVPQYPEERDREAEEYYSSLFYD